MFGTDAGDSGSTEDEAFDMWEKVSALPLVKTQKNNSGSASLSVTSFAFVFRVT